MRTKRSPEPVTPAQTPSRTSARKVPAQMPTKAAAPKAAAPKRTAKALAPKETAKPVRSAPAPTEASLTGGKLWKMSGRNGVAFVQDAALAGELLQTDPKNLPKAAMAVYYDKKGRAFAWQVRFDTERWEEVTQRLITPTLSG